MQDCGDVYLQNRQAWTRQGNLLVNHTAIGPLKLLPDEIHLRWRFETLHNLNRL